MNAELKYSEPRRFLAFNVADAERTSSPDQVHLRGQAYLCPNVEDAQALIDDELENDVGEWMVMEVVSHTITRPGPVVREHQVFQQQRNKNKKRKTVCDDEQ